MENIKSWTLFDSNKNNKYFLEKKLKRLHVCHPLFYHILKLNDEGADIRQWIESLDTKSEYIEIKNGGMFSKQDIDYYYRKFLFLKSGGYFTGVDQQKRLSWNIDGEIVKKTLANTDQIIFELTESCNLACEYCWYGKFYNHHITRENKTLDPQSVKKLLDYLVELWNSPLNRSHDKMIRFDFYGGEPLLNLPVISEIVDYINHAHSTHNRFYFSITTNGILLGKHMDFLYKNDIEVWVSLDGNPENNSYRVFKDGKPSFDTIMENVKAVRDKYPDYFERRVNFIATLHNRNSVSDIYHFFKTNFNKIPAIGSLNAGGIDESQKKEFWKTYSNISQSLDESEDYSLIEKDLFLNLPNNVDIAGFLQRYTDFFFANYRSLLFDNPDIALKPTDTCLPFDMKLFLTAGGKILPCEKIEPQFDLGAVTPETVDLDFEKIADKYNRYYAKMRRQCDTCRNVELCSQCLFYISSIDGEDPKCNGYMTETDFATYISSITGNLENNPGMISRLLKETLS